MIYTGWLSLLLVEYDLYWQNMIYTGLLSLLLAEYAANQKCSAVLLCSADSIYPLLVNQTGLRFLVPETFFFGTLASTKDKIKFLKLFQAVSILPSSNRSQSVLLNTLTLALPSAFYRDQLVTSVVCDDAWKSSPWEHRSSLTLNACHTTGVWRTYEQRHTVNRPWVTRKVTAYRVAAYIMMYSIQSFLESVNIILTYNITSNIPFDITFI